MTLFEPGVQETRFCPYCGLQYLIFRGHEHGREIVIYRCLGCERSVQDFVEPKETTE